MTICGGILWDVGLFESLIVLMWESVSNEDHLETLRNQVTVSDGHWITPFACSVCVCVCMCSCTYMCCVGVFMIVIIFLRFLMGTSNKGGGGGGEEGRGGGGEGEEG